jgi:RNA polymerase sigma factor (sigma-70 family)
VGTGFPPGTFDGTLVELAPARRVLPRSRSYCGTGLIAADPLSPGETTGSGPSAWAMGDWARREPSAGAYVWIVPLEADGWARLADRRAAPETDAETAELLGAVGRAIKDSLTPHQRTVLTALTLNDVPIDVLADRLGTSRGALYKTLHDARRKLREHLAREGLMTQIPHEEAAA